MTNAKLERIYLLLEEMAETQQVLCKMLRFGEDAYPETLVKEKDRLEEELGDLLFALNYMLENGDAKSQNVFQRAEQKRAKFLENSSYQKGSQR